MHPTKIVLIYADPKLRKLVAATIAYNDEEVEKIKKEWNDGYHSVETMDIDYSIRGE